MTQQHLKTSFWWYTLLRTVWCRRYRTSKRSGEIRLSTVLDVTHI